MLYHEKQIAALCGVHCINTLLQGPYLNELDLAQVINGGRCNIKL
jgi:ataxin-3